MNPTIIETTLPGTPTSDEPKRLTIKLPPALYDELQGIAGETMYSMTDLVRKSLALLKLAHNERKLGHKLVIATSDNKAIKEVLLLD